MLPLVTDGDTSQIAMCHPQIYEITREFDTVTDGDRLFQHPRLHAHIRGVIRKMHHHLSPVTLCGLNGAVWTHTYRPVPTFPHTPTCMLVHFRICPVIGQEGMLHGRCCDRAAMNRCLGQSASAAILGGLWGYLGMF